MVELRREGGTHHPTQGKDRVDSPEKPCRDVKRLEIKLLVNATLRGKRHDAVAAYHPALPTHGDVLRPAVVEQSRPDVERRTDRKGRRDLHGHGWGDGVQTTVLPRAHLLNAVDAGEAGSHISGAL